MLETITHPLKGFVIADENVRKGSAKDADIPALADLIADEGLQQPLCGYRKGKTQIAIHDGRRRLLALRLLEKEERLPEDCQTGIPVRVGPKALARQASLSAGLSHRGFHPAEEFRQFHQLIEDGRSVQDIAKTYSMAEREVEKRLRLARLAEPIFAAFARDELSLEQAQAYALSDDQDRQLRLVEALGIHASAYAIRRAITEGEVPASDKRTKLISPEAYEAAGGVVRRDLFGAGDDTYSDPVLLDTLVEAQLNAQAEQVAAEGWSWVNAMVDFDHGLHTTHFRIYPTKQELGEEAQADMNRLQERLAALLGEDEGADLTEAERREVETIDARIDAIESAHTDFTEDDKARGGAVAFLRHDGTIEVMRGLVKREKKQKTEAEKAALPHAVHRRLTEIATQALARDLANSPDIADIVLTAALAQSALGLSAASGVDLSVGGLAVSQDAALPVDHTLAERQETQAELVAAFDFAETIAKIAALSAEDRLSIRATSLAAALDLEEARTDGRDAKARKAAAVIAAMIGCDVSKHWTPDEAFFNKLRKPALLAALKEMGRKTSGLETSKIADLAGLAARQAAKTGWLPEPLRFVHAPSQKETEAAA